MKKLTSMKVFKSCIVLIIAMVFSVSALAFSEVPPDNPVIQSHVSYQTADSGVVNESIEGMVKLAPLITAIVNPVLFYGIGLTYFHISKAAKRNAVKQNKNFEREPQALIA